MPRENLELDDPVEQEEDIGEASPYLSIHILTPTSSTSSSTEGSITSLTPTRPTFPRAVNVPHIQPSLSRKKSLGQLTLPSTPSLPKLTRPAPLTRSLTLPRVFQVEGKPRRRQAELDQLGITPENVEKLRRWIIGIAIVDFDVDDGPVVDGIFPPSILLPAEAENLAFSSFPDSLQFDQGSQCHSFRVREHMGTMRTEKRPPTTDGFIYGFSHFTQKRVSTSKRGYEQRSVVILTQHPFPAFFSLLISIFGPLFQQHDLPMLEAACQNIATWRDPTPGETLELGFLGSVLNLVVPLTIDEQQFTPPTAVGKYDPRRYIAASAPALLPPPLLLFEAALSQLWSLWECLVLCEPILVFGESPAQTSQAIWWLRDLLRPDRVLLRRLETALYGDERQSTYCWRLRSTMLTECPELDASLALRRHFHSRTTEIITPLARYLNTLIPTPTEVARSSAHTLRLKPFSSANFFASLKAHGSTLPFRSTSKRTEFYERLLKTPGFGLWLAQQEHIVEGVLKEKRIL
ncbi:hypothetical protein DXG03_003772 [Asterophora parasitica]|uniref:UDENN domain-containing protein n=1 Tax=Asterophora parasitica TaxID=117018 RepID=A0A9P7G786_9AGAR|nr:hypothetical protein DXG03_003772 [Asterophora parasitica]